MKKTLVRIALATLLLVTGAVIPMAGDTTPRPPICPPDTVCKP
jgi:hypothetical protein